MKSALKERAVFHEGYRLLDVDFVIRSDSREFLDAFRNMYRRFLVPGLDEAETTYFVLRGDTPVGKPVLIINDEVQVIEDPDLLIIHGYRGILDSFMVQTRSHFLIHAGVVSFGLPQSADNQGVILPAYSGHGKTTLVLELVRRGFKFLSDDIAAINRLNGHLDPFPRSLRVHPNTLELCGYTNAATVPTMTWMDKLVMDMEQIRSDSVGGPCPGRYVIVLRNPADEGGKQNDGDRVLYVVLDRLGEPMMADLERISGVKSLSAITDRRSPILKFQVERGSFIIPQVEEICHRHQVRILDMLKREDSPLDFQASPRLEPISKSEAAMELIRRFWGGYRSAILQEDFQGSLPRLFMALADVVSDMECYQLFVGRLDEMADLVCDLVGLRKGNSAA